jgi:hypothetical protein
MSMSAALRRVEAADYILGVGKRNRRYLSEGGQANKP